MDEELKDVCIELVNKNTDKAFLTDKVSVKLIDFTAVFFIPVRDKKKYITQKMINKWNINKYDLFEIAVVNTMRLFPPVMKVMGENAPNNVYKDFKEGLNHLTGKEEALWLTTKNENNNPSILCYKDVVLDICNRLKPEHLFLIVIGKDAVLVVPEYKNSEMPMEKLARYIEEQNGMNPSTKDFVSNSIYLYNKEMEWLEIVVMSE